MSSPNTDGGDPGSCGRFWIFISLGYLNNGRPRRDGSFWVAILVTVLWILIDNTVHEATPRYPQRNENSITGEGMPKTRAQAREPRARGHILPGSVLSEPMKFAFQELSAEIQSPKTGTLKKKP